MRQKVKVGNLVRLQVWNTPHQADVTYGIVTKVEKDTWDMRDRYYIMSSNGIWIYDWDEIDELIRE